MADNAQIIAALRGDSMPFGVGGPAEPYADPSGPLGKLASGVLDIPKRLIDASATAVPGLRREDYTDNPDAPQPNQKLYDAAAEATLALAGTGVTAAEKGAAGSFGGQLSRTADLDKLMFANKAYKEGHTPNYILGNTGWMKDPADGMWKYEISDHQSRALGHGLDYTKDGNLVSGPAEAMLQHPELYKAYPQLKDFKYTNSVYQNPKNGIGMGGMDFNGKALEVYAPDLQNARSVGLHELNHGIQEIEGFAPGGNKEYIAELQQMFPNKIPLHEQKSTPFDMYNRLAGEVASRNVQTRMDYDPALRKLLPPWETMDTPIEQQLILDRKHDMLKALRHLK